VNATAGNLSARATWSPATTIPDGSPITGYKVFALNTTTNVSTSVSAPLCTTACSATVPNLTNGATYQIKVRAQSAAGLGKPGTATGTVSPAGVGVVLPAAPTAVTATAGSLADGVVDATVSWSAPATQPSGITVEAWRVTAYDATTQARIKRVFLEETGAPRTLKVGFASTRSVFFRVQAIAADDAGTLSNLSAPSGTVTAQ
jgi:hypothetical protein